MSTSRHGTLLARTLLAGMQLCLGLVALYVSHVVVAEERVADQPLDLTGFGKFSNSFAHELRDVIEAQ